MRKLLLLIIATSLTFITTEAQTMTFSGGASEPNFTFNGWTSGGGTIWHVNLANPATVTVSNGYSWDFTSFKVGPFVGANTFEVTSNLGHSYTYSGNTAATHTLNWSGVTTVTFTRISGSGASADHDDFVYSLNSLGVSDIDFSKNVKIFPTVNNGAFTLSYNDRLDKMTVFDITGKYVKKFSLKDFNTINEFDLNSLSKGMYFLTIESQSAKVTKRIIIE